MLYALSGTVHRLHPPQVYIDVAGVGYGITVPMPVWDALEEGTTRTLIIHTYVREDRLDLFGFLSTEERTLFTSLIGISGVGPKLALELCGMPRDMLTRAVLLQDATLLTQIKGVGKKTAERLLVDLKSLMERLPSTPATSGSSAQGPVIDRDALAALISLGYAQAEALESLHSVPEDITRTEDRVSMALRSLSLPQRRSSR